MCYKQQEHRFEKSPKGWIKQNEFGVVFVVS